MKLKHLLRESSLGQLENFFIGSKNFNAGYDAGLVGKNKQ